MRAETQHLTDEQLVRAADRELSPAESPAAERHLATCVSCRERFDVMAAAVVKFARAYREAAEISKQSHNISRARFRARLAEAQRSQPERGWLGLSSRSWAAAVMAILVAAIGIRVTYERVQPRDTPSDFATAGPLVPDAKLTPGAVRALSASQVCTGGGPREDRPPSSLQRAVFHEYGMDGAPPTAYEVDHLITPALGGSDDIRNLWPEPYSSEWNAHVKDELEDYLHAEVCTGKIDLATAQREIATNWISAYQKYFHTDRPLPRNSELIRGRDPDYGG
ncbi:MAG: zf-HC2 domain-containing protein [Candidatus Acidiferrales bacterium]